jgi:hypothetical protein
MHPLGERDVGGARAPPQDVERDVDRRGDDPVGDEVPRSRGNARLQVVLCFLGAPGPDTWCSIGWRLGVLELHRGLDAVLGQPEARRVRRIARARSEEGEQREIAFHFFTSKTAVY